MSTNPATEARAAGEGNPATIRGGARGKVFEGGPCGPGRRPPGEAGMSDLIRATPELSTETK